MAEATLADVTKTLKDNQKKTEATQSDTTRAIDDLSERFDQYFQYLRNGDKLEDRIERNKKQQRQSSTSSTSSRSDGDGLLSGLPILPSTITSLLSFISGTALALEGLGPSLKSLELFKKSLIVYKNFILAVPKSVTNLVSKLPEGFLTKPLAGVFSSLTRLKTSILRFFGIGADGKNISIRNAQGAFAKPGVLPRAIRGIIRLAERIKNFFGRLTIPQGLSKTFAQADDFFKRGGRTIINSPIFRGILRFLRPIALIFSAFDGIENATAELEDREGYFNRIIGGGIGGFTAGALGSFFGEFFNLVKDAPLWIIKKFVPADWLIENPDGSFSFDSSANIFTKVLSGIEMLDFNAMITEIVQAPFNALGESLDFIRNLFGAEGTTEEGRTSARDAWNKWWGNWKSLNGIAENVTGVASFLINAAFKPVDVVLRHIMAAFGADESLTDESDSFLDRIRKIVDYVFNLIPSVEEIKTKLAGMLSPKIATAIGLGDYLPMTQENFNERASSFLRDEQELEASIARRLENIKNTREQAEAGNIYAKAALVGEENALTTLQNEYMELQREFESFKSRAVSGGISETTINNNSPTFESNYFPNASVSDRDDPLRQ